MLRTALFGIASGLVFATFPVTLYAQSSTTAPVGFSGHAHAHVHVQISGTPIDVTAHIAVRERDGIARFDVAVDPGQMPFLPTAPVTLVVDQGKKTLTMWNDATKVSFVQSIAPPVPGATPAPSARSSFSSPSHSPLADLDVFAMNLQLTGHSTIVGLATTGLALTIDARKKGDAATAHVRATMDLADDFAMFPVTIGATIDPGKTGTGTFDYAIDDFVREPPPLATFDGPSTYRKVDSAFAVFARAAM